MIFPDPSWKFVLIKLKGISLTWTSESNSWEQKSRNNSRWLMICKWNSVNKKLLVWTELFSSAICKRKLLNTSFSKTLLSTSYSKFFRRGTWGCEKIQGFVLFLFLLHFLTKFFEWVHGPFPYILITVI